MTPFATRPRAVPPVSGATGGATPLWFGPAERPLFGWVHTPVGDVARGAAILCAPLGREQDIALYTFRRMADELAARGVLTIRFDYDGTGDSAGGDEDPDRVRAWQQSIAHAADLARRCGAPSLVLVGMRTGALLAASATRATGATGLVAWDPCTSGRSWVREQHALQRLHFGRSTSRADEVELPGFVLSAETASELGQLEPDVCGSHIAQALVLMRPSEPVPTSLSAALAQCTVELGRADGQEVLLEGTGENQLIPLAAIDHIVAWVAGSFGPASVPVHVAPSSPVTLRDRDGAEIVERTVRIAPAGLFGIEASGSAHASGPTMIFVNNGLGSHVGPNRMWVLLSRRWAAAGLRCVRLDLSGIADSPSRDGKPEHEVHLPAAFDDLLDAAGALSPDDPTDVVFVGLCSGGYQALEAALALKARGACVVNPVLRFRPPELEDGPLDPRRRLCRPITNASRVARRLPELALLNGRRVKTWREVGFGEPHKTQASWVDELAEAHVDTLCICGEDEARSIAVELSASGRPEGIDVQVLPDLDHALLPAGQRAEVIDRLTNHALGHFAPATVDREARVSPHLMRTP